MSDEVASALSRASEIAGLVAASPGPIGIIAKIASLALKAGSAFAAADQDPVVEIQRILSASPEIAKVHNEWDDYIAKTFGDETATYRTPPTGRLKTDPPPPSESPGSFSKRDTDPTMPAVAEDDPYEEIDDGAI
jgi:hypothetical protein